MKNGRKVFIPELNMFGEEHIINVGFPMDMLDYLDVETLNRILETQIRVENYEMADVIKEKINLKNNGK